MLEGQEQQRLRRDSVMAPRPALCAPATPSPFADLGRPRTSPLDKTLHIISEAKGGTADPNVHRGGAQPSGDQLRYVRKVSFNASTLKAPDFEFNWRRCLCWCCAT